MAGSDLSRVALLAALGHEVTASTGRMETADGLKALGAANVIDRAELAEPPARPMLSERWAGAIDAVGGTTLASILAGLRYGASVASCGLAGGNKLDTTVVPFLLRGVRLLGIDSVMYEAGRRRQAWGPGLRPSCPPTRSKGSPSTAGLGDLPGLADEILAGRVRGRTVVDVNA